MIYVNDDFRKVAPQGFADKIKMFDVDPLCDLVVNLIDGGGTYAREPGKVGLRQAQLAELS